MITSSFNENHPFRVECKEPNCFFHIVTQTLDEAREWDDPKRHKCPRGVDSMIGASVTKSLLEKSWEMLDELTATLKATPKDDPEILTIRGKCRGVAEVLAIFMVPHFRTADEVAREALKRWKAAQDGEEHSTPGLGALKYTFPSDPKYKSPLAQMAQKKEQAAKGTEQVDAKTRTDILFMKDGFTAQQVGDLFSVSVATVERIWTEG